MLKIDKVVIKGNLSKEIRGKINSALPSIRETLGGLGVNAVRANFDARRAPSGVAWPPSHRTMMDGGQTLRDRGSLYKSIDYAVLSTGTIIVFVNPALGGNEVMKYAMIHNFGGTIKPKTKKFLTIPVHPLAKGRSVAQMSSYFKIVFFVPGAGGKAPVIMGRNSEKGKAYLLYILKTSVKIPRREYMGISADYLAEMRQKARKMLAEAGL